MNFCPESCINCQRCLGYSYEVDKWMCASKENGKIRFVTPDNCDSYIGKEDNTINKYDDDLVKLIKEKKELEWRLERVIMRNLPVPYIQEEIGILQNKVDAAIKTLEALSNMDDFGYPLSDDESGIPISEPGCVICASHKLDGHDKGCIIGDTLDLLRGVKK